MEGVSGADGCCATGFISNRWHRPELGTARKEAILAHCEKLVAKYAMPYDIEFRNELPKTLVGKVAYTVLEKEELEKQAI